LQKEQIFRKYMARLQQRFPSIISEVRGRGLILGMQLAADPTLVVTAARERGLLIITCGTNTLRFVPPLIVSESEIEQGMRILEDAMAAVFETSEDIEGTDGQQEMRAGQ
jgi:acetylornithine aminotransferase